MLLMVLVRLKSATVHLLKVQIVRKLVEDEKAGFTSQMIIRLDSGGLHNKKINLFFYVIYHLPWIFEIQGVKNPNGGNW